MSANQPEPGKIVTFYSYKGGTGRSMAVVNFAYWLAREFPGLRRGVLVMDWDLEAPGLHRFFAEVSEAEQNSDRPGVVDYFHEIQKRLRAKKPWQRARWRRWHARQRRRQAR